VTELLMRQEVYDVVGAAMAVYNELGPGFLEAVYQEAMEIELRSRQIPFVSLLPLIITYKGQRLKKQYEADIVTHDQLIVELKALDQLGGREEAQLLNYLKATGHRVGVLINFGHPDKLDWRRMVR